MMKLIKNMTGLVLALALSLSLCACSGNNMDADKRPSPSLSPSPSLTVRPTDPGNDATRGGGAGGTNDLDNDGWPDESPRDRDGYNPGGSITGEDEYNDGVTGDLGRMFRRAENAVDGALRNADSGWIN